MDSRNFDEIKGGVDLEAQKRREREQCLECVGAKKNWKTLKVDLRFKKEDKDEVKGCCKQIEEKEIFHLRKKQMRIRRRSAVGSI